MFLSSSFLGLPAIVWLVVAAALIVLTALALSKGLNTREISVIAVLVSACLASNYALIWLPNVKVMDLIVFVSGLRFGAHIGGIVGVLVWAIYGSINPYGFVLPIWLACMAAESLFGVTGGLVRAYSPVNPSNRRRLSLEMAVIGVLLTFAYDLATNLLSALTISWFETRIETIIAVIISGIPFAVVHEVSNGIIFFLGVDPLSSSIEKIAGSGVYVTE